MIKGVFLYYRGAAYIEEALAALRNRNLNIQEIEVNSEMVSNLVPGTLQRGTKSWLIFFHPDRQQELLILPFPDERNRSQYLENVPNFSGYLADLIPILNRCFEGEPPNIPPEWIGRFQYIRPNVPLDSLLNEGYTGQDRRLAQRIQNVLQGTSQIIQQQRSEILRRVISTRDPSLFTELDDKFLRENDKLFYELLDQSGYGLSEYRGYDIFSKYGLEEFVPPEFVPPIVKKFEDIIDPETKDFLITSETVRKFAYRYLPDNFDYSAPGCGLWKAVERELNLSLVLHLRLERGIVANINAPLTSSRSRADEKVLINTDKDSANVNINLRELNSSSLRGIELGPMQTMLRWGHNNGIHSKLKRLFRTDTTMQQYFFKSGVLVDRLEELRKLRNGHAHISAMSPERFEELRKLVLPSDDDSETCLVKILQLKRKVFEHELERKDLELVYSQIS